MLTDEQKEIQIGLMEDCGNNRSRKNLDLAELPDYALTPKKVALMVEEYGAIEVIPGDSSSYKTARGALTTIVHTRTGVDKRRKELNEEAHIRISQVNQAAKKLIEPLSLLESRLKNEIKGEDDRKAAIKAEKERKEGERVESIRTKIFEIQEPAIRLVGKPLQDLSELLRFVEQIEITRDEYMEFTEEAEAVRQSTLGAISCAMDSREKYEKEEIARKEEGDRLERIRTEQEDERARLEKLRKQQEDRERIFNEKFVEQIEINRDEYMEFTEEAEEVVENDREQNQVDVRPAEEKLLAYVNALMSLEIPVANSEAEGNIVAYVSIEVAALAKRIRDRITYFFGEGEKHEGRRISGAGTDRTAGRDRE